nr:hypothetical protein BaRGS_006008 [Batillaria attramentaria]
MLGPFASEVEVTLTYPDLAVDQFGNAGFWTIIYNQGFEVVVAGRKFFAFSKYEEKDKKVTSYCNELLPGWRFYNDMDFIAKINSVQSSWRAAPYPHLEGRSMEELVNMAGGPASRVAGDQASCGSCYAFASMAMNEARVRIMTNNTKQPVFSPQDIVDCSEYSQGCAGGFPYLIGGKYAEDFGLVLESDNPYKGKDLNECKTPASAKRHYSTKYEYVGGYYGACNEPLMRQNLYENGPIAVGFEVLKDFMNYKGGIYHHTGLGDGFAPFELTNHAVLVVGYGEDKDTGEQFWIVKNSWGEKWGEQGFFRIRRGTDECAFESMAVQSTPIIAA